MSIQNEAFEKLPPSIQSLVRRMITQLSPHKIILFGSRARGDHRDNSDFDIAVLLPPNKAPVFTRFVVDLEEEPFTLFKVDLVELEKLDQAYQNNIAREGRLIYVA